MFTIDQCLQYMVVSTYVRYCFPLALGTAALGNSVNVPPPTTPVNHNFSCLAHFGPYVGAVGGTRCVRLCSVATCQSSTEV